MLAYVYGVVPISLCRSGGCGVSAGNGKGVRIEFDDENDIAVGGTHAAVGKEGAGVGWSGGRSFSGSVSSRFLHNTQTATVQDTLCIRMLA